MALHIHAFYTLHNHYCHGAETSEFTQSVQKIILDIPLGTKLSKYVREELWPITLRARLDHVRAKRGAELIEILKRRYPDRHVDDYTLAEIARAGYCDT